MPKHLKHIQSWGRSLVLLLPYCESKCATPYLYEQRIEELFLEAAGILMEKLNKKLFHRLVDHATVYPDGRVVFTFRNRVEVSTEI